MSPEEIKSVIASYYTNLAAMNAEGVLANFAEGAISHDPVGEPPAKVHEGFSEFIARLKSVFDNLATTTESIFIAGNSAAVKWKTQGTSKTGKTVTFEGITIFDINDSGKIQTTRAYWSPADMIAQLRG
ncbi:MAG: nuclear transport factor 2 family protein [Calothrix sp. C42_A2020_038]|nr:nuclear transport factor 2 family protein [Calothrix sp. C42_A2020_038]